MTSNTTKLASLIASRICHDLISPVGAISNGLELMALGLECAGPELEMVTESCEHASARIRFFRIAYGAASDATQISRKEIVSVLEQMSSAGRITYDWVPREELARQDAQLAFLAIQCVETTLPRGGRIRVDLAHDLWTITAQSERIEPDLPIWEMMDRIARVGWPEATDPQDVPPRLVQFLMLPFLARAAKRQPLMEQSGGQLILTV